LVGRRSLRMERLDALLLASLVGVVAYFSAPESIGSGGSLISERLVLFPVFGVVLWLAAQPLGRRVMLAGGMAATMVAVALMALRLPAYRHFSAETTEYLSVAPHID